MNLEANAVVLEPEPELFPSYPVYQFPAQNERQAMSETEEIKRLPRVRLHPSETNPRKQFNPEKLDELAGTLKQFGVLEPLLVRVKGPERNGSTEYEIIAGERRWRASELAGLAELPCRVMRLTDAEVLEIQYIENLQRDDLTAIEEAEGFKRLIESGAYTAESLAALLGKSRSHVFGRLKLCRLEGPVREALAAGELAPTVAELVSRVPRVHQAEALKNVLNNFGTGEPMSFRRAKDFLEQRFTGELKEVPWNLDDRKLLPEAGPCTKCPKRSENCREEYPDIKSPNVCTDLECLAQKRTAFRARLLAEEAKRGQRCLTLAECDEIFRDKWLTYNSGYIEREQGDPISMATDKGWIDVAEHIGLGTDVKPLAAVDPTGVLHWVYRKSEIEEALFKVGIRAGTLREALETEQERETAEQRAEREAKEQREAAIRKETLQRQGEAVIAALEAEEEMGRALRLLVCRHLEYEEVPDYVLELFGLAGLDHEGQVLATAAWAAYQCRDFLVRSILTGEDYATGEAVYLASEVERAAEIALVDLNGIAAQVREELEPTAETPRAQRKKGKRK